MDSITIIVKPNFSTYEKYRGQYLQEITELLNDLGTVEIPSISRSDKIGITLVEVLEIYLIASFTKPFLSELAKQLAERLVNWVVKRSSKGKGPRGKVHITIYGPDGEQLKIVDCDRNGNEIET